MIFNLKTSFRNSIKFRSLLIIATTVTVIQLLSVSGLIFVQYNNLKESYFRRINLIADIQADALANPIWDFNNETVDATLRSLEKDSSFIYAYVVDSNNKILYQTDDKNIIVNDDVTIEKPIIYKPENKNLGTLKFVSTFKEVKQKFWSSIFVLLANFVLLQIFILSAAYFVIIDIINPIQTITGIVNFIKDDKLENDIKEKSRSDEIGAIANAVDSLQISIKNINLYRKQREQEKEDRQNKITQLIENFSSITSSIIESVTKSSVELNNTAKQMVEMINNVDQKTLNLNSIADRTAENISNVAGATEGMNGAINEIASQATKSTDIARVSVEQTDKASQTTSTLEKAVKDVEEIVLFIGGIAKQINLLALNATIESVRAGEAGKGFAVVANEVKNLAWQTRDATKSIGQKIENIQQSSKETISSIGSIKKSINSVNEYATAIASAVEEQNIVTKDIFSNMKIASSGTQEMVTDISSIKSLTSNTSKATSNVLFAAENLSSQAVSLSNSISNFVQEIKNV